MSERAKRRQLGRGLAALFGETEIDAAAEASAQHRIPIELIRPSAFQPRRRFAEAELDALAQSIREKGILQPLLVRPLAGQEADFELVAGERRWRAAQRIGMHEVPVIVRPLADSEALEIALVENLQREDRERRGSLGGILVIARWRCKYWCNGLRRISRTLSVSSRSQHTDGIARRLSGLQFKQSQLV